MNLQATAEMLARSENVERNLNAARTGERFTFRYRPLRSECSNCGLMPEVHVMETGIMFCPEWALREGFGR